MGLGGQILGEDDGAGSLGDALAIAGLEPLHGADIPLFNAGAVAAGLLDRDGAVVCASPAFAALGDGPFLDADALARAVHGAAPAACAIDTTTGGAGADVAMLVYARADRALGWRLPPEVRAAAVARPDHVVALTSGAAHVARPLEEACRAYGLTGLQARVVMEVIRAGHARLAAEAAGVSYHTAREALAEAMRRVRVQRLPALVTSLTSLAFGVLPQADAAAVLEDLWGLTPRQAAVAALIAEGASRASAAVALGVTEAVVRKELERIHLVLQVSTGAELARKVVEANALRWLTEATGGDLGFVESGLEPLRFIHGADGRRIAVSDYGPASGAPLVVLHSNLTTRIIARGLLRALQRAGYRPIAIDRPGFGLTDDSYGAAVDPFAAAAADMLQVLDHLKLARVDVAARGAAQVVLALHVAAPERLGRVVLVNPAPHTAESGERAGFVGALKAAYLRNPALVRAMTRFYLRNGHFEQFAERLQRGARGSPPDEAATRDVEIVRDYFRAMRPFATGRFAGYVNEVTAMMRGARPAPVRGASDWRILLATHDFLHDPAVVARYWRDVLPETPQRVVPDSGRYLALSQPDQVVAALREP